MTLPNELAVGDGENAARLPPAFLTVDDEPDINWILGRLIAHRSFPVHHALCAQDAIDLSCHTHYRAVFVDAKLPDMSGLVLIKHLRNLLGNPFVVLISGYFFADDPVVEQATQSGLIQGFVAKPFRHAEILALIDQIAAIRTD
jgi:CheY-like chemotaxis protein